MKSDILFYQTITISRMEAHGSDHARMVAMQRLSQEALEDGAKYLQSIVIGIDRHGWEIQVLGSKVEHPAFYPINRGAIGDND